jgi:hypothetical protein
MVGDTNSVGKSLSEKPGAPGAIAGVGTCKVFVEAGGAVGDDEALVDGVAIGIGEALVEGVIVGVATMLLSVSSGPSEASGSLT